MTLTLRDVSRALDGAWGLAFRDVQALTYFDFSEKGFWNSFWAAAIAAPLWLWLVLSQRTASIEMAAAAGLASDIPPLKLFLIAEGGAYLLSWFLFALMMLPITKILQVPARYAPYIITRNWAMVLVYFIIATPLTALENLGVFGPAAKAFLEPAAALVVLTYLWHITRLVLGITGVQAAAVILFDVLLSVFLSLVVVSIV